MVYIVSDITKGCDVCFSSAYSDKKALRYITKSKDDLKELYKCPNCKCYWEFTTEYRKIIEKAEAKEIYGLPKFKINFYVKILLYLIYVCIFYYAWAKYEGFGAIVTLVEIYLILLMNKK